ncbi:4-alpha-glucanotransferase [bacterium]|nr:MAG: 4-alpha-glucanotransferase [bacterium]
MVTMQKRMKITKKAHKHRLNPALSGQSIGKNSQDNWKAVSFKRRAGVLVPLFSVYSQKSLGLGDLSDLKLVIDWCSQTGNSILQFLPMNECGPLFCPYDSISAFALEPMYLCLEKIPLSTSKDFKSRIKEVRAKFPTGNHNVNYAIKEEKLNLFWDIYIQEGRSHLRQLENFQKNNAYWIDDFALFKVLKYHQAGRPWYDWDEVYRNRDQTSLANFRKEHAREINFQVWLQWQLNKQFKEIKRYAQAKKILLKGDMPLLVSRDSADVWVHPKLFKLDFAAGAPVDSYCAKGQRWGMPTYNWDKISASGYRYLKDKLKYAENFYDILRIDHVVGLFRIWSIPYNEPLENKGLNGFFDPDDEDNWSEHGRRILRVMLENTNMLLCAEDLGVIPRVCPETLKSFAIPGNDVQRWVKDWNLKHDFLDPADYRVLSVTMLSTHDTTNWAAWWQYEAGTVDQELFMRMCASRGIDYNYIKNSLFDLSLSRYGRLRWLKNINSVDNLANILGKRREEISDFIELYENSYMEKEKLWKHLKIKGLMKEGADKEIISCVLKKNLESSSVFCIQTIIDWLYPTGLFKENPYKYRINTPGTISPNNWSLVAPLSLEKLLSQKFNKDIRGMIISSGRL